MKFETPDYVELLLLLAENFKAKITDRQFEVTGQFGKGYFWAEKLPSGITILVSDTCLRDSLIIELPEIEDYYFTLQFNEEAADDTGIPVKSRRSVAEFESFVKLSHTLTAETFVFPSTKRLRSVKFFFNRQHLSSLVGKQAFEEVVSLYFPMAMQAQNLDPIATEYRVMLDDLWSNKINQPLKLNYIQNRVLLLLEKYIVKLFEKKEVNAK